MVHESAYHDGSSFVTLTYDNEHLPADESVSKYEFQTFMKRLRKSYGARIRYFACGEYGTESGRPHYHAIIFGLAPCGHCSQCSDWHRRRGIPPTALGRAGVASRAQSSENNGCYSLAQSWDKGFIHVSGVGYDSARYVADYVQKDTRPETYGGRNPPFALMSQGIGKQYLEDNHTKLKKSFSVRVGKAVVGLPRYYQKKLCETHELPEVFKWFQKVQSARRTASSREELIELLHKRYPEKGLGVAYIDTLKQKRWNISRREALKRDTL